MKKTTEKITKCKVCGNDIIYKTAKPSKCEDCKDVKKRREKLIAARDPSQAKGLTTRYKGESLMFQWLSCIYPNELIISNGYYSFLPSPKGAPMQLDWYAPNLKLAFEYSGEQHYKRSKYYKQSKTSFAYLQECDKLKEELCAKLGITLISISYKDKITEEFIRDIIKKNIK